MKVGGFVRCIRSQCPELYSVGSFYEVEGLARTGMLLRDNYGDLDKIPIPMDGVVWTFEPVNQDDRVDALIKILEISQADAAAGRVMTREQLLDSLSKD